MEILIGAHRSFQSLRFGAAKKKKEKREEKPRKRTKIQILSILWGGVPAGKKGWEVQEGRMQVPILYGFHCSRD
jgi:hypothetical protein